MAGASTCIVATVAAAAAAAAVDAAPATGAGGGPLSTGGGPRGTSFKVEGFNKELIYERCCSVDLKFKWV